MPARSTLSNVNPSDSLAKTGDLLELKNETYHVIIMATIDHTINHATIRGVVLHSKTGDWKIGQNHDGFDRIRFKPFHGSVTLAQD